jgi:hypothetical protein
MSSSIALYPSASFSLDAAGYVTAHDRAAFERPQRYCAPPPFALARLERPDDEQVVCRLPEPQRDGTWSLTLAPLKLIDHLSAVIPPSRRHRHRDYGLLAPQTSLRAAIVALGGELSDDPRFPIR